MANNHGGKRTRSKRYEPPSPERIAEMEQGEQDEGAMIEAVVDVWRVEHGMPVLPLYARFIMSGDSGEKCAACGGVALSCIDMEFTGDELIICLGCAVVIENRPHFAARRNRDGSWAD